MLLLNNPNEKWYDLNNRNFTDNEIDDKQALFRIIPFDSLLEMFNERTNTLVRTKLWEDKYENFILNEKILYKGKETDLDTLPDRFYGQCWTSKTSSDAMWRIYSPDKKSVRIRTSIGKLKKTTESLDDYRCLINKVRYYSQKQIEEDIKDLKVLNEEEFFTLIFQSLFVKRNSFSHESEYRIIYISDSKIDNPTSPVKQFQIDPYDFIENIYFDPRADDAYVERCRNILNKTYQYPIHKIRKSSLYSFTPQVINVE